MPCPASEQVGTVLGGASEGTEHISKETGAGSPEQKLLRAGRALGRSRPSLCHQSPRLGCLFSVNWSQSQ